MGGAFMLAVEVKKLLIGEAISTRKQQKIAEAVKSDPAVHEVVSLKTMVIGPEEVLVAIEVDFEDKATVREVEDAIDRIEARVRDVCPGAKTYIEAERVAAKVTPDKGSAAPPPAPASAAST